MKAFGEQAKRQTYRVVTGSGTDIGLTRSERVVVVHVDAGHDESTTHDVELATGSNKNIASMTVFLRVPQCPRPFSTYCSHMIEVGTPPTSAVQILMQNWSNETNDIHSS
jgi:hypothetical protein